MLGTTLGTGRQRRVDDALCPSAAESRTASRGTHMAAHMRGSD